MSFILFGLTLNFLVFLATSAPPLGFLPNIVILYGDDYGWGDTNFYGHPISITPNINRLIEEGTKLNAFYSASPVCSPSRAALLTGRLQTRTGVYPGVFVPASVGGLPLNEITIAEFLKSNGLNYSTAIVGKWHLGTGGENGTYLPTNQGFDTYLGIPYSHDMPDPPYCFPGKRGCWPGTAIDPWNNTCPDSYATQGFNQFDYDPSASSAAMEYHQNIKKYLVEGGSRIPWQYRKSENTYYVNNENLNEYGVTDPPLPLYKDKDIVQQPVNITNIPSMYTDYVLNFMTTAINNNQNFFVYMAYHQTHHPQFASPMFFNTSQRGMFGDAQREMDYNIGLIMDFITSNSKISNNTFVFFSADNGPSLMRESRGGDAGTLKCGKGTTFEGGVRVPGIAWMPNFITSGRESRQLGSTMDVLPTILELVDIPLPTDRYYDGVSMYNWLFKPNGKSLRDTFYYFPKNPKESYGWQQSLSAVRVNQYKMHWIIEGSHCPDYYADTDCRGNNTQHILSQPKLFNLFHDVGERYPLNVSLGFYGNIVKQLNDTFKNILGTQGLWGQSEINKGQNETYAPCCNWGCSDYPSCCTCDKLMGKLYPIKILVFWLYD